MSLRAPLLLTLTPIPRRSMSCCNAGLIDMTPIDPTTAPARRDHLVSGAAYQVGAGGAGAPYAGDHRLLFGDSGDAAIEVVGGRHHPRRASRRPTPSAATRRSFPTLDRMRS